MSNKILSKNWKHHLLLINLHEFEYLFLALVARRSHGQQFYHIRLSETDEHKLIAEGNWRTNKQRRVSSMFSQIGTDTAAMKRLQLRLNFGQRTLHNNCSALSHSLSYGFYGCDKGKAATTLEVIESKTKPYRREIR